MLLGGGERGGNCILITVLMVLRSARWKVLYRYAQNKSTLCSSPPLRLHFILSAAAWSGSQPSSRAYGGSSAARMLDGAAPQAPRNSVRGEVMDAVAPYDITPCDRLVP